MTALQETQEAPKAPPGDTLASHESTGSVSHPPLIPRSGLRIPRLAVPLLLFLLAFVFMLPGLPPLRVAAPMENLLAFPPWQALYPDIHPLLRGHDMLLQQLPWHHWMQDELKSGRFPLWASGPVGGAPIFAYYQVGALYPLHLLWAILPTGTGLGIIMALKLWLAGLGMWLFLRALGLHPMASLLGALGFMFSAGMVVWLPWGNSGVELLLPWFCWAVYAWCVHRKRGALVGLAILTAFAIFGGNPEITLIVAMTVGIWTLGLLLATAPRSWPKKMAGLAVSVAIGGVIGAIQLLPFFEAADVSYTRYWRALAGTLAWARLDIGMAVDWILPRWWGGMSDGVLGGGHVFTEANAYVGLAALIGTVLALVGIFRRRVDIRLVLPWFAVVALGWVFTYDDAFGYFLRRLPVLNELVSYRWIETAGFALVVVGAFGWDWLMRPAATEPLPAYSEVRSWRLWVGMALAGLGLLATLAHLLGLIPYTQPPGTEGQLRSPDPDYRLYWTLWTVSLLVTMAGVALLWRLRPSWRSVLGLGMVLLVVADLWRLLYGYNITAPAEQYYPETRFISQLRSLLPPNERVVIQGEAMPANTGLIYNIRDWRYQDPMLNLRAYRAAMLLSPGYEKQIWTRYNMFFPQPRLEVAPMFGIRYAVYSSGTTPDYWEPDPMRPPFKRLAFAEGMGLWEIEGVPGFTYLSDYVEAVPGEPEAKRWLQDLTWEKVRAYPAVVEAPADSKAGISRVPGASPGSANVLTYTPGHITIQVEAQRPALLVVAESYYPGWHATLDNQPTDILRTNYISQGVVVPTGEHIVELKYEPDSFRNGALLSLMGLFGLLGLTVWWRQGARRA